MTSYAGVLPRGDPDVGVPVGQIFSPPYLFKQGGGLAARPVIKDAPEEIKFRGHFDIEVEGDARQIASVVLLRSDHNTHSLTTGDRYVKLAFRLKDEEEDDDEAENDEENGELRVVSPKLPAQAVPGIYMLFVVDKNGVPSMGQKVVLEPESRGPSLRFQ
jgi:hypothetical protein